MTLTVVSHITLDGVVQAPARSDEDTRDGFVHGGWSVPYGDEAMMRAWGVAMTRATEGGGLLLGHWTYLDFAEVWPRRVGNPMGEALAATPKYVASTSLAEPLPWRNSTLLTDPIRQVQDLRQTETWWCWAAVPWSVRCVKPDWSMGTYSPSIPWCWDKAGGSSRPGFPRPII